MLPKDEAKSIVHIHSIFTAALVELRTGSYMMNPGRPTRTPGSTSIGRQLRMAPDTFITATKLPRSMEDIRGGLLRVRVPEAQNLLFNRDWWRVEWIPSREPLLTQPAWNHLYERAAERGLLTYFRKKWYSQLSPDMERLPVLVVDLIARAVGYPCGIAVRDPKRTCYDKRAQLLTRPDKPLDIFQEVDRLPALAKVFSYGTHEEYWRSVGLPAAAPLVT